MPKMLDSDVLATLIAIADTGSFTRAGDMVGRTQSAVSMQMKRLEELIGRPLFAREGRNLHLTGDGERMLVHARRIVRMHHEALSHFLEPEMTGVVRIGIFDDLAERYLPVILSRFAKTHPLVELDVYAEDSHPLLKRFNDGWLDLALVGNERRPDGEIVLREPLVWVTSGTHCTHEMDPLPVAMTEDGCSWRRSAIASLKAAGRAFRVCYTSRNHAGLVAPVAAGLAVSALPLSSVRRNMRILGESEGFGPLEDLEVVMLYVRTRCNPALEALADHVRASLASPALTDPLPYGGLATPRQQRLNVM